MISFGQLNVNHEINEFESYIQLLAKPLHELISIKLIKAKFLTLLVVCCSQVTRWSSHKNVIAWKGCLGLPWVRKWSGRKSS